MKILLSYKSLNRQGVVLISERKVWQKTPAGSLHVTKVTK